MWGCPMSPYLLVLVAKGLSRMVNASKREGTIKGIKMRTYFSLSYLLFVNEEKLFGM